MGTRSSKWLKDVDLAKEVDRKTAERIWAKFDTNHDGFLDKEETKKFIIDWCHFHEIQDVEAQFNRFWAKFELREELKISKEDLLGDLSPAPSPKNLVRKLTQTMRRESEVKNAPPRPEDEFLKVLDTSIETSKAKVKSDPTYRAELTKRLVKFAEQVNDADRNGSSIVDIQKGLLCLLQGAAYRVYGVDYAAEPETHQPDKTLPYTWSHFAKFVRAAMELYKSMEIVDEACHGELDALAQCVEDQEKAIRKSVAEWTPEKQTEWEATEDALYKAQDQAKSIKKKMEEERKKQKEDEKKAGTEISPAQQNKRNMYFEGFGEEVKHAANPLTNLEHRFRVLLDSPSDEALNGCVCPMRFWYEVFMPRLLAVCSVRHAADLTPPTEAQLDGWFERQTREKKFIHYGQDVVDGWSKLSVAHKLNVSRAWKLVVFYLNGVQKQRERIDAGEDWTVDSRADGDLSMYVAFIDVYLSKSYVQAWAMRLSFPYFLGPNTWIWHHTAAERAVQLSSNPAKSARIVANFKTYILEFIQNYPCPYCRNHLNHCVIRGAENEMYPVEYLFVGWEPSASNLSATVDPAQKVSYIQDARTLSLFVWKLHNAVNSSIKREEEWYQAEAESVYTSRYWPNIDAELYRAEHRSGVVPAIRIRMIMELLKTAKELTALRDDILALQKQGPGKLEDLMTKIRPLLSRLDSRIVASGFLQETYGYQPGLVDVEPDPVASIAAGEQTRNEDFTLS